MEPITRTMTLNRITKGAARFKEVLKAGEPEVLGSIYLKRWALGEKIAGIPNGDIEDSTVSITVQVNA